MRSNSKSIQYYKGQSWQEWTYLTILLLLSKLIVWMFKSYPSSTSRSLNSVGKVLVVGDDIAFGYGDYVLKNSLGICSYLPFYLNKERKLRTNWKIFNVGYHGSTSQDWIPGARSGYFNNLKNLIRDNTSTIIVLFIGANDTGSVQESISNIKLICKELSDSGVLIFLNTLPTWGDEGMAADRIDSRRNLNVSIKDLIHTKEIAQLQNGVDLDASNFEYRVLNLYISDGMHFSSAVSFSSLK